jgi:hypothetical protein
VVCLKCVAMKPRRNEEAQAHIRLSSRTKKKERCEYNAVETFVSSAKIGVGTCVHKCMQNLCVYRETDDT